MPTALIAAIVAIMPGLIASVSSLIKAVQADPATPGDVQAQFAVLAAQLDATAAAVAAVEVRSVP